MVFHAITRLLFALLLLFHAMAPLTADSLKPEAEFLTRGGMAPFGTVDELLLNPRKIYFDVSSWQHEDWKVIRSETDLHAIYPYPVEYFVDELLNFENTKNNFPRVVESVVEYASDDPFGLHTLRAHIDIRVLGFGAEYVYVTNNWMERKGNGYLQKYNLNRCPDGTLYQLIGSWYVEGIEHQGKPHTYIRNYSVIGIRKGSLPMEVAMRAFGIWQLSRVFSNINRAVERRINGE